MDETLKLQTQLCDLLESDPMTEWQPDMLRAAIALIRSTKSSDDCDREALLAELHSVARTVPETELTVSDITAMLNITYAVLGRRVAREQKARQATPRRPDGKPVLRVVGGAQ